jgi:chorismate mutase
MSELEKLRKKIDEIDNEILELLNKRADIVLDVAHIKRNENAK